MSTKTQPPIDWETRLLLLASGVIVLSIMAVMSLWIFKI
jgi:hypothetical protein